MLQDIVQLDVPSVVSGLSNCLTWDTTYSEEASLILAHVEYFLMIPQRWLGAAIKRP